MDGHPQLLVYPAETGYLAKVSKSKSRSPSAGLEWELTHGHTTRLYKAGFGYPRFDIPGFDYATFARQARQRLNDAHPAHASVMEALLGAYAMETNQAGKKYWIEKTPGTERYLQIAARWYPHLKALYVIRDPRDVFLSFRKKLVADTNNPDALPIEKFLCRWGKSVWLWHQFARWHGNSLLLRYEDLVQDPQTALGKLCTFLGIDPTDEMLSPTIAGRAWSNNSSYSNELKGITRHSIGRWQTMLSEQEVGIIETFFSGLMMEHGYPLSQPRTGLFKILRAWLGLQLRRRELTGLLMRLYWPSILPRRLRYR